MSQQPHGRDGAGHIATYGETKAERGSDSQAATQPVRERFQVDFVCDNMAVLYPWLCLWMAAHLGVEVGGLEIVLCASKTNPVLYIVSSDSHHALHAF